MSRRASWVAWLSAAVVILGVMAWVTVQMLGLQRQHLEAQQRAEVEEQVRLALWRLDSLVPPLLSEELANVRLQADGLPAGAPPPFVRGRFILRADGEVQWLGEPDLDGPPLAFERLADRLERPRIAPTRASDVDEVTLNERAQSRLDPRQQRLRNSNEWSKRSSSATAVYSNPNATVDSLLGLEPLAQHSDRGSGLAIYGNLRPLWVDGELVVARLVRGDGIEQIQGSLLNWEVWRTQLQDEIADLLPGARFESVGAAEPAEVSRALASLPVVLEPGSRPAPIDDWSPVQWSLVIGWTFAVLALGAMASLVAASLSLSDRRAAFVSAVTHELRTPLTTFRMYAEMLSEGMVDPHKRDRYLRTLRREADRLGHLVENVLAYAKIESHSTPVHVEIVRVRELMARMEARLHDRARADGLELDLRIEPPTGEVELETNPTAIEQILFNLVDNAAKYAGGSDDPRLDVVVTATQREVRFVVRDRGPGVLPEDRARVFEPFTKSKADEAGTRPGAGLGLALCREQARHLQGRLILRDDGPGAAFELSLPRGEPRAGASQ